MEQVSKFGTPNSQALAAKSLAKNEAMAMALAATVKELEGGVSGDKKEDKSKKGATNKKSNENVKADVAKDFNQFTYWQGSDYMNPQDLPPL